MIDLLTANTTNLGYILSLMFAGLALVAVFGYAFWIQFFLKRRLEDFENPAFRNKFGQAYLGIRKTFDRSTLTHYQLFVARRIIFCFIAVFMVNQQCEQLQLLFLSTIVISATATYIRPYSDLGTLRMEVANDYFMLIILYHMVGFTEVLYDAPMLKYNIGTSCTAVTLLMIIVNASDLIVRVTHNARISIKKKIARMKA